MVVKNSDLSIKVLYAQEMVRIDCLDLLGNWVNQARSFSDLIILDCCSVFTYSFDIHADRRHFTGFRNVDPILMNSFDNNLPEISILVRTKHHDLVKFNSAFQNGAT